jgi:hypothetical protein
MRMIIAFITRRNSPNVSKVNGIVSITNIGLRKALRKAITKATSIAVGNPFR